MLKPTVGMCAWSSEKWGCGWKYDYREEWLRLTHLLSATDEAIPLRDRAIMSLANPVESPGGALWR